MTGKKKGLGFEIRPISHVLYSTFNPEIRVWGPLIINKRNSPIFWPSPMSAGINYGLSVFEGMKAFRHKSGEIFLFRPRDHAERFCRSLRGLFMPEFPKLKFMRALYLLITLNSRHVPKYRQGALYVRPIAWGNDKLGFGYDSMLSYTTAFWCSPVGNYYTEGLKPISVWLARNITRAMPGGVGSCKASGNYEISRKAQLLAKEEGCQDALFLDGRQKQYIEELGAANIFIVRDGTVYAPLTRDTVLSGITRKSVANLAQFELRRPFCAGDISVESLLSADEVFATGTAAVVTPIGKIKDGKKEYVVGSGQAGPVTQKLYDLLTGIQYGDIEDKFGWLAKVT